MCITQNCPWFLGSSLTPEKEMFVKCDRIACVCVRIGLSCLWCALFQGFLFHPPTKRPHKKHYQNEHVRLLFMNLKTPLLTRKNVRSDINRALSLGTIESSEFYRCTRTRKSEDLFLNQSLAAFSKYPWHFSFSSSKFGLSFYLTVVLGRGARQNICRRFPYSWYHSLASRRRKGSPKIRSTRAACAFLALSVISFV